MFNESSFRPVIRSFIRPGMKVLDLGSGECLFASELAKLGAEVFCIDKESPKEIPADISFSRESVWYEAEAEYDAVLLLNVIHWMDRGDGMSLIKHHLNNLKPGGLLFMETLSKDPEPSFNQKYKCLYSLEDFADIPGVIYSADVSYKGQGVKPEPHVWFSIQKIWQRPRNERI